MCISLDYFLNFVLQFLINAKNPIVKQCILEYIKILFNNNQIESIVGQINCLEESHILTFSKSLVEIIKNESQSNIKDLCIDLLLVYKTIVKDINKFLKVIDSLPQYRKSMFFGEKYNSETNEKQYKAGLKRIKSNLSFRNNTSTSTSKERKITVRSISSDRKIMNNSLTVNQNNKPSKNNKNLIKKNIKLSIDKPLNENKNQNNNIQTIKSNNDNTKQILIKNKVENTQIESINKENKQENISIESSLDSNKTNKSVLEQKMDSAIAYIYTLKLNDLKEYLKTIIRDFLIFIKKQSNKEISEDLDSHFIVIVNLLDKILDRLKSKSLDEDIYIQTFKIITISPCYLTNYSNLHNFIKKLRNIINNDDKFYQLYYDVLNKFISFENNFLKNINNKFSVLLFLEVFLNENEFNLKSESFANFPNVINDFSNISNIEKERYINIYNKFIEPKKEIHNSEISVIDNISHDNNITDLIEKEYCDFDVNNSKRESIEITTSKWKDKYENEKEELLITQKNNVDLCLENEKLKERLNQICKKRIEKAEDLEKSVTKEYNKEVINSQIMNTDISKIKETLKQNCKKLDLKIQRLTNTIDKGKSQVDDSLIKDISVINNNYKPMYKLEENNDSEEIILTRTKLMTENEDFSKLILKIPSLILDNNITEIALFVKLESQFSKIIPENKIIFIEEVQKLQPKGILMELYCRY